MDDDLISLMICRLRMQKRSHFDLQTSIEIALGSAMSHTEQMTKSIVGGNVMSVCYIKIMFHGLSSMRIRFAVCF